jgi:hypothetical protein
MHVEEFRPLTRRERWHLVKYKVIVAGLMGIVFGLIGGVFTTYQPAVLGIEIPKEVVAGVGLFLFIFLSLGLPEYLGTRFLAVCSGCDQNRYPETIAQKKNQKRCGVCFHDIGHTEEDEE